MGQLVTPQKAATVPTAPPKEGASPRKGATTQPKVAPQAKVGTISPPRKPAPKVTAVKRSLARKAQGSTSAPPPVMAASTRLPPAPL